MNKKILILLFLVSVFLGYSFSVSALALSGKHIGQVVYKPGTTFTNSYEVYGSDKNVVVQVDSGGVFKHFRTTPLVNGKFEVVLDFPADEYIAPGEYVIGLSVREESPKNEDGEDIGGIGALVAVSKKLYVIVYAYEKDVQAGLDIPNINQGSKTNVNLGVNSVSYKNIDMVKADIILYDDATKTEIMRKMTKEKKLKSLQSVTFKETFDTEKLEAKQYFVRSLVTYDGITEEVNKTFLIGNMDLVLKDYSRELAQGYSDFSVTVANNWGNELKNIKAKLFLDGDELLEMPTISLGAWQEGQLKGIVKVDLKPDLYTGELQLFFEGESKKVPIEIRVVKSTAVATAPTEQQPLSAEESNSWIFISVAILIVVIGIVIYLKKRRGESADEF